jgi:hypothetical protein
MISHVNLFEVLIFLILHDVKSSPIVVFQTEYDMSLGCKIFQYRGKRRHGIAYSMSKDNGH